MATPSSCVMGCKSTVSARDADVIGMRYGMWCTCVPAALFIPVCVIGLLTFDCHKDISKHLHIDNCPWIHGRIQPLRKPS